MIKRTVSQDFRTSVKKLFFSPNLNRQKRLRKMFRFHDEIHTKTLTTRTRSQRSRWLRWNGVRVCRWLYGQYNDYADIDGKFLRPHTDFNGKIRQKEHPTWVCLLKYRYPIVNLKTGFYLRLKLHVRVVADYLYSTTNTWTVRGHANFILCNQISSQKLRSSRNCFRPGLNTVAYWQGGQLISPNATPRKIKSYAFFVTLSDIKNIPLT